MTFTREQFASVINVDPADWKAEMVLHEQLFAQLSLRLPKELPQTKARIVERLSA